MMFPVEHSRSDTNLSTLAIPGLELTPPLKTFVERADNVRNLFTVDALIRTGVSRERALWMADSYQFQHEGGYIPGITSRSDLAMVLRPDIADILAAREFPTIAMVTELQGMFPTVTGLRANDIRIVKVPITPSQSYPTPNEYNANGMGDYYMRPESEVFVLSPSLAAKLGPAGMAAYAALSHHHSFTYGAHLPATGTIMADFDGLIDEGFLPTICGTVPPTRVNERSQTTLPKTFYRFKHVEGLDERSIKYLEFLVWGADQTTIDHFRRLQGQHRDQLTDQQILIQRMTTDLIRLQ